MIRNLWGLPPTAAMIMAALVILPAALRAQSVVVDQGTFAIEVDGETVGTEEFSVRRAGFGNNAVFIANGVVTVRSDQGERELRPLLRATAPAGATDGYELKVTGWAPVQITMNLAGPRFLSRYISPEGREEREFRARRHTRILENSVAHHYYFLKDLVEGARASVIAPSDRAETSLLVGPWVEEELSLGVNTILARRVAFSADGHERVVWFDRQGRVLRVEIPADGYVAVRQDLVG